jgi:hypothetical protein
MLINLFNEYTNQNVNLLLPDHSRRRRRICKPVRLPNRGALVRPESEAGTHSSDRFRRTDPSYRSQTPQTDLVRKYFIVYRKVRI